MSLYVSQNVHGGWLADLWDWFKSTFLERDSHTGATEAFGQELAGMAEAIVHDKQTTAFEKLFGPDAWVRRELNSIEGNLSDALHSLLMETYERLGVDYGTYVAALGVAG
jgi:hypothetical protein